MAARSRTTDELAPPKPKSDAYTGMLIVSLLALLGACAFLYLDYSRYPKGDPPRVQPSEAKAPTEVPAPNPPKPDPNAAKPMPMPKPMPMK